MLVSGYKLEVIWQRGCCSAWQKATATLTEDIGKAIPVLASKIEGAQYNPAENTIRFSQDGIAVSICPTKIEINYVENENQARTTMERVKDMLNQAYS